MAGPSGGRKWERSIRAAVREACETWQIQATAGSMSSKDFETIVNRAAVPILAQLQDLPLEVLAGLVPSLVRVMLAAAVELVAEAYRERHDS